jgi:triacylglycerol lipase
MNMQEFRQDFERITEMPIPVKRAAFSDRTAWMMAILAELAYEEFDEEKSLFLPKLAAELAGLTNQKKIEERLRDLQAKLAALSKTPAGPKTKNKALKATLEAGGFKLAGGRVIHNEASNTQGFVACRPRDDSGAGMAVICFRGTQQIEDWLTNVRISSVDIRHTETNVKIGKMHKGFHDAYKSVEDEIVERLQGYADLPLYITGHSLGGALAVVATWYQSSEYLAACYTFGAPRVGDQGLIDRFRTPIYRIVNGPDPMTLMPPAQRFVSALKIVVRVLGVALPFWNWAGWVTDRLIKIQKFRHYGYMRYLTVVEEGARGDYPRLKLEFGLSTWERLLRFIKLSLDDKADSIPKYHGMKRYRAKLRAHAVRRYNR